LFLFLIYFFFIIILFFNYNVTNLICLFIHINSIFRSLFLIFQTRLPHRNSVLLHQYLPMFYPDIIRPGTSTAAVIKIWQSVVVCAQYWADRNIWYTGTVLTNSWTSIICQHWAQIIIRHLASTGFVVLPILRPYCQYCASTQTMTISTGPILGRL